MSVFSNRADGAAEGAEAYIEAVLGLLGDEDPISVLSGTPSFCRDRIDGVASDRLRRPEAEGKWSAVALLEHLADSELVWGYRLRSVLAEERPEIRGFDQDVWASRLAYFDADPQRSLTTFDALRTANLALLESLDNADLQREGVHAERGGETVAHMIRLYAGHDLAHRAQLDRILNAASDA
ncbi:MAG: DinB family protein [Gemmatimonadota bacterium]